ncbi:TPA: hypothetical protein O4G03_001586 [Proteus mirabilis]|uniref:Uncharacterized protein n=2 Tax=Proteus mirabilis TaxID=584 RepID=A0AAJ0Y9V1_PROMI|nr:hypothetical protein [Proteus mirabilis]ARX34530.1 hypothetical protein AM402_10385 [Proteus mirabilis]EJD6314466.1 hypothetical protein [Proteus mirabilis]EJD6319820.1 hypothetical protein [Proteus mirabilis]EJD6438496.1 hypothetical protein [Proteus mirabilis]EJD6528143.1 hypothetical protein [Proteus mirabilis]
MAFDWIAGTALVVGMGSLYLTWQSTKAAKRAIDTSIEIYNKQKVDNDKQKEDERLNAILGISDVAGKEAFLVLQYILFIIELQELAEKAETINFEFSEATEWNSIYFNLPDGGIVKTGQVPNIPKYFSHEVLINSAICSPDLFSMLLNLNGQILVVEKTISFLMKYIKNDSINALRDYLNNYIPRDGKNMFIRSMLKDTVCFEKQMKDYNGYLEVKSKIKSALF